MATKKQTTKKVSSSTPSARAVSLEVVLTPRITEKAAQFAQHGTYLFDVVPITATKNEIAKAFYAQYKQTPVKITTVRKRAKSFFRRGTLGFGPRTKKAYVILPKGTTITIG